MLINALHKMRPVLLGSGALHFSFEKATVEGKVTFAVLVVIVAAAFYFVLRKKNG